MKLLIAFFAAAFLTLIAPDAHAQDTFVFAGASLTLPDGWKTETSGNMATLYPPAKGGFIEVYNFSKLPAASADTILKMLKPRKNTTDISVKDVRPMKFGSTTGLGASGKAKIKDAPVSFVLTAIPTGSHAVLAIGFLGDTQPVAFKQEVARVLGSLKVAAAK
ncbi:MAG: hypothetical protein IAF08_16060 [Rhizobacter sp.]|nr:hypothetical protein [Chlorobiales bacterium]